MNDPATPAAAFSRAPHFERRLPSAQTATDVFRDRWASDLSPLLGVDGTGPNLLFTHDNRMNLVAENFGKGGALVGQRVLELGPLEGAHSYLLERLGADEVVAVESNAEAWMKCLVIKELLNLKKVRFLFGDANEYLEHDKSKFDVIVCSGILYHLDDPMRLIRNISLRTNRCFIWSHYYDPANNLAQFTPTKVNRQGLTVTYWNHTYGDQSSGFWGGHAPVAAWVSKDDLLQGFRHYGFSNVKVLEDQSSHPNGPAFTFVASKAP